MLSDFNVPRNSKCEWWYCQKEDFIALCLVSMSHAASQKCELISDWNGTMPNYDKAGSAASPL